MHAQQNTCTKAGRVLSVYEAAILAVFRLRVGEGLADSSIHFSVALLARGLPVCRTTGRCELSQKIKNKIKTKKVGGGTDVEHLAGDGLLALVA
jgi:hypothetical protein